MSADHAVKIAPKDPRAYVHRGLAQFGACDFPAARADAQQALSLNPKDANAEAIFRLSNRPAGCNQMSPLEQVAQSIRAQALLDAETAAAHQDTDYVLPGFDGGRFTEQGARNVAAWLDAANKALKDGDSNKAYGLATRAIIEFPENPGGLYLRAVAGLNLGRNGSVMSDANAGLKLRPNEGKFHGLRAAAENKTERYSAALKDAGEAIRLDPKDAGAWRARAEARERLGYGADEVLEDYRRAAELNGAYGQDYQDALARAQAGKLGGAQAGKPALAGVPLTLLGTRVPLWAALIGGSAVFGLLGVGLAALFAFRSGRAGRTVPPAGVTATGAAEKRAESRYDVEPLPFARGGMGTVHAGYDRHLQRKVAVKRLHPQLSVVPRERERFRKEALSLAKLTHPHIVSLYDFLDEDGQLQIVFEYVAGKTLHELVEELPGRCFSADETARILEPAAQALGYAHAHGVVHRDVKPSNIMVAADGVVKVMDFGISRTVKDTVGTLTNTPCGTPFYMAPEQEAGVVRRESDNYGLAVTAFELVTGVLPFSGPEQHILKRAGRFDADVLPENLRGFFRRALDPQPDNRWHEAADMARAFAEAVKTVRRTT
ncbi:MAG: protein kinase [Elusimicrobia bacterium]|nr:protein kinase [Elusimicrobiota bacterium]